MKCGTANDYLFLWQKNPSIPRAVGIFFVWAAHLLKSIFRKWNNGKILHTDSMLAFPLFPKLILPTGA